jgi:hypothetical protein
MIFSEISFSCIIYMSSAVLSVLCASALRFSNLRNQLLAVLENTERPTRDVRNVSYNAKWFLHILVLLPRRQRIEGEGEDFCAFMAKPESHSTQSLDLENTT